jgi:hypothetical protein
MIENFVKSYLNNNAWATGDLNKFASQIGNIGPWNAKDWLDRWLKQSNYPVLFIDLIQNKDSNYSINVIQNRHLNSNFSIFHGDLLYPSIYEYVLLIHLTFYMF